MSIGSLGRRAFLSHGARVACAGAALAAMPVARSLTAAGQMYISCNGSLMPKRPDWPEFARIAARVGYPAVDLDLGAARKQGLEATRALLAELKLTPGIASLPVRFGGDEAAFQEGMAQLPEAAAFAAAVGCPRMMAVMPPASATPKPEYRTLVKDRMLRIAEVLQRAHVRLGLEFLGPLHFRTRQPHEFIWRMNELVEFCTECGPNIGLTLDAWHWHHAGATEADIHAAGLSRIVHIHVSDAKQQPPDEVRDNQRLMPGEGIIDLTTFFRALQKIGYTDAVSPEPIGRPAPDLSAEDGARLGLETTRAAMKKAGVL